MNRAKKSLLVGRKRSSEILCGPAGTGKSFDCEPGGAYHQKCKLLYFGAQATHCAVHETIAMRLLGLEPEHHPPIILNDVADVLSKTGFSAFLQQLLSERPLSEARNLTYVSRAMDPNLQIVKCHSPVMLILNEIPSRLSEIIYSLVTRAGKITIFDLMPEEMHRYMRRWVDSPDKQKVYEFVEANIKDGVIKRHHLRWYNVLLTEMTSNDNPHWKKWAVDQWLQLSMPGAGERKGRRHLNERGKLQVAAGLYPHLKAKSMKKSELYRKYCEECNVLGVTGGSERDFYNTMAKYQALMRS